MHEAITAPGRTFRRQGPPPPASPEALRELQDRLTRSRPAEPGPASPAGHHPHPAPDAPRAEWAGYFHRLGFRLCAIPPGKKGPIMPGWPEGNLPAEYWLTHPQEGLGVVLGPSRLVSLDLDSLPEARAVMGALGLELDALLSGAMLVRGNPERLRAIFRAPTDVDLTRKSLAWPPREEGKRPVTVFELRGGPVQDVLPPTIHPDTGRPYEWITPPWELERLGTLPDALLELWTDWGRWHPALIQACPWAPPAPEPAARTFAPPTGGPSVVDAFNQAHDAGEILRAHGYRPRGEGRWIAPSSESGLAGVVRLKSGKVFSHHGADPLADGFAHDAFDLYRLLEHGGDHREAVKAAARLLGMDKPGPSSPPGTETRQSPQERPQAARVAITPPTVAGGLIATEDELAAARLAPRCIVAHHTYADVAVLTAAGGVGKTTLLIHESVHVALGWPVWGLPVEAPGWTLFVTAEDRREQFLARLREILATLALSPEERARALWGVRVWDVTGEGHKLVRASDGNVILTDLADAIVTTYRDDPPAIVVFDPLVSFGASEGLVNDGMQGIIEAARRIVKGLDCCCRLIHHVGKVNARAGSMDQYSARGGSALPDGSRMTTVLATWKPDEAGGLHPPPGCLPGPDASITILARAKLSFAPPNLPLIWVRREGFAFTAFTEQPKAAPEVLRAAHADQLERFLLGEVEQGRRYNATTLGTMSDRLGMTRDGIRHALAELKVSGRVVDEPLPPELRHGGRQTYLSVRVNPAEVDGRVPPESDPQGQAHPAASTTLPPYRDRTLGRVVPRVPLPPSLDSAAMAPQSTAELAEYTNPVEIMPAADELEEVEL